MVYVHVHDDSMHQIQVYDDDSWFTTLFDHLQIIIISPVPVYWIYYMTM